MVGSAVTGVVLPLVVYEITGSAAQTGALFALRVVPYLVFGLVAGPIADRGNRRRLIVGGNIVEGVLVATIPIADLLGVLTVAQIYVVALLAATAYVFSDAAVFGAVPALVGPKLLPAANGVLVERRVVQRHRRPGDRRSARRVDRRDQRDLDRRGELLRRRCRPGDASDRRSATGDARRDGSSAASHRVTARCGSSAASARSRRC